MIRFLHQILLALKAHKAIFLSVNFKATNITEFFFRWFVHFESSWSGNNIFILSSNFWKEVWHWLFQQRTCGPQKFFLTPRRQDEFSVHKKIGKDTSDDLCQLPRMTYDVIKYWVNSNVLTRVSQFANKHGFDVFFRW